MKIRPLIFVAIVTSVPFSVNAEDLSQGKEIHDESCLKCHMGNHDEAFYTRKDRKMKSKKALMTMIRMCDAQIGTSLFDEDIEELGKYLNQSFYKFPIE